MATWFWKSINIKWGILLLFNIIINTSWSQFLYHEFCVDKTTQGKLVAQICPTCTQVNMMALVMMMTVLVMMMMMLLMNVMTIDLHYCSRSRLPCYVFCICMLTKKRKTTKISQVGWSTSVPPTSQKQCTALMGFLVDTYFWSGAALPPPLLPPRSSLDSRSKVRRGSLWQSGYQKARYDSKFLALVPTILVTIPQKSGNSNSI